MNKIYDALATKRCSRSKRQTRKKTWKRFGCRRRFSRNGRMKIDDSLPNLPEKCKKLRGVRICAEGGDAENLLNRSELTENPHKSRQRPLDCRPSRRFANCSNTFKSCHRHRCRLPMGHGRVLSSRRQRSTQRSAKKETQKSSYRFAGFNSLQN